MFIKNNSTRRELINARLTAETQRLVDNSDSFDIKRNSSNSSAKFVVDTEDVFMERLLN